MLHQELAQIRLELIIVSLIPSILSPCQIADRIHNEMNVRILGIFVDCKNNLILSTIIPCRIPGDSEQCFIDLAMEAFHFIWRKRQYKMPEPQSRRLPVSTGQKFHLKIYMIGVDPIATNKMVWYLLIVQAIRNYIMQGLIIVIFRQSSWRHKLSFISTNHFKATPHK